VRLALNKKWETLLKNNYKNKNGWRYDSSGRQEQVSEFNPNITKKKKKKKKSEEEEKKKEEEKQKEK
jgi:hypothetical protein